MALGRRWVVRYDASLITKAAFSTLASLVNLLKIPSNSGSDCSLRSHTNRGGGVLENGCRVKYHYHKIVKP